MVRWFCILVMLAAPLLAADEGLCSMHGTLGVRARASISSIQAQGGSDMPIQFGTPVGSGRKSVARAMLLSALLPGLGEIYAGGTRGYATGAVLAATDIFSVWRYFDNNGKGDDKKGEYEAWARDHYSRDRFDSYVRDTIVVFSGYEDFGFCTKPDIYDSAECWAQIDAVFPLSETGSGAFHEQIGLEDRYVFGWDDWYPYVIDDHKDRWLDWNPYEEFPSGIPTTSPNKETYRSMRREADDFYGKADKYAWIMVIGRVVSMVDAAILVRLRNRDLAGIGTNPRLSFKASLGSKPDFKVGLKMRF